MTRFSRRAIKNASLAAAIADHRAMSALGLSAENSVKLASTSRVDESADAASDISVSLAHLRRARLLLETVQLQTLHQGDSDIGVLLVTSTETAVLYAREHLASTQAVSEASATAAKIEDDLKKIKSRLKSRLRRGRFVSEVKIRYLESQLMEAKDTVNRLVLEAQRASARASRALSDAEREAANAHAPLAADLAREMKANAVRARHLLVAAATSDGGDGKNEGAQAARAAAHSARSALLAARALATSQERVHRATEQLDRRRHRFSRKTRSREAAIRALAIAEAEAQVVDYIFGQALVAASVPTVVVTRSSHGLSGLMAALVKKLLPTREGLEWWSDITSMLDEADAENRHSYIRSHLRNVHSIIYSSWAAHIARTRATRSLSYFHEDQADCLLARPDDPPGWRLLFAILRDRAGEWRRAAGLLLILLGGLTAIAALAGPTVAATITVALLSASAAAAALIRSSQKPRGRR